MADDTGARTSERELDYAYVHEVRSLDLHSTFIRLVPKGGATPATTFDAECTVDVDGDGNVIGVTIHRFGDGGRIW